jgi:hypothetical protein
MLFAIGLYSSIVKAENQSMIIDKVLLGLTFLVLLGGGLYCLVQSKKYPKAESNRLVDEWKEEEE